MKLINSMALLLIFFCITAYSQDKQTDFKIFKAENIEFTALKSLFYLIRQEYVLVDDSGKPRTRGGNDFYGKAYTIGVIDEFARLWYPTHVRFPWQSDPTYDRELTRNMKPECSVFGIKNYSEENFFMTKLPLSDKKELISFILFNERGIELDDSLPEEGTLIIFYTATHSPDNFNVITHSLIFMDGIKWDSNGVSEVETLQFGNNRIIGGALFSRHLGPGSIRWKLAGFYIPVGEKWIIKSMDDTQSYPSSNETISLW